MKYFVFSIDDGTVFDRATIELFNRYGVRATFNLNSGLDDFVWYYEGKIPIYRNKLEKCLDLYRGHEVASHSLTHPYLDSCSDEEVIRQSNEDIWNLQRIFGRDVVSFATPFETCGDREAALIRDNTPIQNVRLSVIDESFAFPSDPFHIKITALDIDRALELLPDFLNREKACFVYAGHSYDFYVGNSFDRLEELLRILTSRDDVKIVTMAELVDALFHQ